LRGLLFPYENGDDIGKEVKPMAERRMTLGEKVRALRLQLGMTQAELAGEEFTKSFISQIEKTRPARR
jgi:hypothetical protein